MSVVVVWTVFSEVCHSDEVSVQSSACPNVCVCVCACMCWASLHTDIFSSPSELLLSPFPQPRHNNLPAIFPHVLPFIGQGPSKAHHTSQGKTRQGGERARLSCKQHAHTFWRSMGEGWWRLQGRTGGGHAEEEEEADDGCRSARGKLDEEEEEEWVSDKVTQRDDNSSRQH